MAQQVIEGNKSFYKNKIENGNGANYMDNDYINDIDEMINEKYIDPKIIKQKANNDAVKLIKEREKEINKNVKNKKDKSPRLNGNKIINNKKVINKNKE